MVFAFGFLCGVIVLITVGAILLVANMEEAILAIMKRQLKKMDDKITRVKTELNYVKTVRDDSLIRQMLGTIHDYEAMLELERNKERAKKSMEDSEMRELDKMSKDEAQHRSEVRTLGKEIVNHEKNPVIVIDAKEQRRLRDLEIKKFKKEREERNDNV